MNTQLTLGERLTDLRKEHGFTIAQVKEITGISTGVLSDYENNKKEPGCKTFKKLADLYGVSYDYLFCVTDSKIRDNVDVSSRLGLSDIAVARLEDSLLEDSLTHIEISNVATMVNKMLEDSDFCENFTPNYHNYMDENAHRAALRAIVQEGIITQETDGSAMFMLGMQQALITHQHKNLYEEKDRG